jgi:hypothetical protein
VQTRPKARTEGVLVERVGDELVVYDQASQMGHCLSATAASVWKHCDGCLAPAEIADVLRLELTTVQQAVDELHGCGLLDDQADLEHRYSRREAAVKFARVGGAGFMAPLIYSVAIAPATAAASACVANGSTENLCAAGSGQTAADARCCSGTCYQSNIGTKTCVQTPCVVAGGACVLGLVPCCAGAGNCTGIVGLTCAH